MRICEKTLALQRRSQYNLYEKYNFYYILHFWRKVMADNKQGKYIFGTVKVGEKGQIVIPKEARSHFGIQPGDTLLVLGDEKSGLIISRPEAIRELAMQILAQIDEDTT